MAGFRIDRFRGLRPRISAKKLTQGEAVTAQNLKLGSNDLEPIPEKTTTQAVGSGRSSRTIYKFDNDGSPLWFEWDDYVDVVRGPVKDDSLERTYYTGDTFGNGSPKLTTTELADLGGGGPYPEDWLYLGVPAPVSAPTVSPEQLPEDQAPSLRLCHECYTDTVFIDEVRWTVYPGTGTRDTVWNIAATANGSIAFDIQPGTSFRVTEIINRNYVALESATEPGITMQTRNRDKTTVNDWHPMENNGSTQTADWLGWRVPPGMSSRIVGHRLLVGDVITVSAINNQFEFFAALTTDFNEEDWAIETEVDDNATSYYVTRDAEVSGYQEAIYGYWRLAGSFYYDVDRASSASNELEDRSYVYTYVNEFGEEGPPSEASAATPILDGQSVLLKDLAAPPTIGYNITQMRIYRTNSTEAGTEFQLVDEFDIARTARDEVLSKNLGEVLSTTTWDPPDPEMIGLTALPNGILAGFNGKQLYFCEPYFPHAWPAEYDQAVDYEIVGMAAFGNSLAVLTKGWPYIVSGSHPRNMNVRALKINQSCLSKESIATDGDKVYYASPDGLVELGVNGVGVRTEPLLDPEDWSAYSPETMVGEFYEGRYYGFWGFDASAVDSVVTAELSGTITSAEEADITAGGETIIITLTNDEWVAAGVSFNNARAAIIAGLTCTTSQTNGWNNILRDTIIQVGDVVRTSDTVCTITLPAAPTYGIDLEERIDCTVPASALVLSNSALPCGSHFRITPNESIATLTLTGTLGGAAEADVVAGGKTIILTLTNDTWVTTLTDAMKQLIVDGLVATTNEIGGWNDTVLPYITASSAVVRTGEKVVTITLPAVPVYSVTASESITATIPYDTLVLQDTENVTSGNSLGIVATGVPTALFGGSATASMTENEVIAGGKVLTITLTNDTWIAAGTGPIGTTAQTQSILDALVATTSQTLGWNNVVQPGIETADLVRTSDTVATITLDAESTYSITTNETIGATLPGDLFTAAGVIVVGNTFSVVNQSPITAVLGGTVTASVDEFDIVAGGDTLTLTLSNDTWLAAGTGPIGSTANTQAIIDGIDSAQSEGTGWDAVVKAGLVPATHVVRTSDEVCTITLPAFASYDITADETITATIPAAALNISAAAVVASPTFDVSYVLPTTAAVTGTATASIDESDIVAGGKTIIITLTNNTWVAAGATFNAIRQDIIDGLDSAQSEGTGWNAKVRDVMAVTTVVRTSDTVATITLPATADYDVTSNETITVTVPASALAVTSGAITASPTFDILAQIAPTTAALTGTITASVDEDDITAGGKTIILTLTNDTWLAASTGPIGTTANTQAIIDGIDSAQSEGTGWDAVVKAGLVPGSDVVRTSDTVCTITLPVFGSYDISATETITATIPAAALNVSATPVVASPTFNVTHVIPPTAVALTGTITASIAETDVVTGGKTIILTLTDDTWLAAGTGPIGSTANTQALIDGITAAASPANGWNNEIRDGSLTTAQVVRTSDTVCTITLVADAGYDITANETITITVPAAVLNTSSIPVVADNTFGISATTLTVSPNTGGHTVVASPNPTICGIAYYVNGQEWATSADGAGTYNVSRGAWLDAGSSSDVWVERIISAGSLDYADPGAGRLNLGSARTYAVSDTSLVGGSVDCTLTLNFYDAASGGNLIGSTGPTTLSAERIA